MQNFLSARKTKLEGMGSVYAATVTRIASYQYVKDTNTAGNWESGKINALSNDGKIMPVVCDPNFKIQLSNSSTDSPLYSNYSTIATLPNLTQFLLVIFLALVL